MSFCVAFCVVLCRFLFFQLVGIPGIILGIVSLPLFGSESLQVCVVGILVRVWGVGESRGGNECKRGHDRVGRVSEW